MAFSKTSMRSRLADERMAAGDWRCIGKKFVNDVANPILEVGKDRPSQNLS